MALAELEKLKAELEKAQSDQNAALKRAEKAEAKLVTVQQELSGLKRHISNMTQAIFGKSYLNLQPYPPLFCTQISDVKSLIIIFQVQESPTCKKTVC